jgi:hypothetical protein
MNGSKAISVTFDTNALDKASRPNRYPKGPSQPDFKLIHTAIRCGLLRPFFCETVITLEGIQRVHRIDVLGSTQLNTRFSEPQFRDGGIVEQAIAMRAVQPKRSPLHGENVRRLQTALAVGFRVLSAPRIAWPRIDDPEKRFTSLRMIML